MGGSLIGKEAKSASEGRSLADFSVQELFEEIAKRFKVRYGRIQMAIHAGRAKGYANVDMSLKLDDIKSGDDS